MHTPFAHHTAKDLIDRMLVVNPAKRYTAENVLAHPWVTAGSSGSAVDISKALLQMKKFNARRKFRAGIRVAKAIQVFQGAAKV